MKSIFSDPFLSESDRASLDRMSEAPPTGPGFVAVPPPPRTEAPRMESALPSVFMPPSATSPLSSVISRPEAPKSTEEDPITLMRKIVMGGQVDDLKDRLQAMENQLHQMRTEMDQKVKTMENALRTEFAEKLEKTAADLSATMDDRFRKVSAASVPRTHLAEILRDLSSSLHPSGV